MQRVDWHYPSPSWEHGPQAGSLTGTSAAFQEATMLSRAGRWLLYSPHSAHLWTEGDDGQRKTETWKLFSENFHCQQKSNRYSFLDSSVCITEQSILPCSLTVFYSLQHLSQMCLLVWFPWLKNWSCTSLSMLIFSLLNRFPLATPGAHLAACREPFKFLFPYHSKQGGKMWHTPGSLTSVFCFDRLVSVSSCFVLPFSFWVAHGAQCLLSSLCPIL